MDIEEPRGVSSSQVFNRQNNNFVQQPTVQSGRYGNTSNNSSMSMQQPQYNPYQNQPQTNVKGLGQNYGEGERLNQYRSNYQQPDQRTNMNVNNMMSNNSMGANNMNSMNSMGMQGPPGVNNRLNQYRPQQVPQKVVIP